MEENGIGRVTPAGSPLPPVKRGGTAVVAALTAIAGLFLSTNPDSQIAQAVCRAVPQIGAALPPLIAACGTIVAAISQPPKLR